MTACTPIYGLTYPIGSDRPCDQATPLCAMTNQVEVILDRLDLVTARTVTSVPQAQVRVTVPLTQAASPGGSPVYVLFDTVDVDTDNMVDLTVNPYQILLPFFGRYFVYWYATFSAGPGVNAIVNGSLSNASHIGDQYVDDTSAPFYMSAAGMLRYNGTQTGAGNTLSPICLLNLASTTAITISSLTFGLYWLGDL